MPLHLWHLTTLSPFLRVPLPSQFLQGFFFSSLLFRMVSSQFNCSNVPEHRRNQHHFVTRPRNSLDPLSLMSNGCFLWSVGSAYRLSADMTGRPRRAPGLLFPPALLPRSNRSQRSADKRYLDGSTAPPALPKSVSRAASNLRGLNFQFPCDRRTQKCDVLYCPHGQKDHAQRDRRHARACRQTHGDQRRPRGRS